MFLKKIQVAGLFFLAMAVALRAAPVEAVHTTIELSADTAVVVPGETFHLGVTFAMEPHWHIYWKNPGASGLAPEFTWELPEGFEVGEVQWPAPARISLEGLVSYGYENTVTFIIPVTAPDDLSPGSEVPIGLDIFYLICKEVCLPGEAQTGLKLRAGPEELPQNKGRFAAARASQPEAEAPFTLQPVALEDNRLTVAVRGDGALEGLYFYSAETGLIDPNAEQPLVREGDTGRLQLTVDFAYLEGEPVEIAGVLQNAKGTWQVTIPAFRVGEAGAVSGGASPDGARPNGEESLEDRLIRMGLVGWLLLAFIGGLILNIMPCVLPVLSLKVFSLLHHSGQSRAQTLAHGLAYTLGVVASFLVLAGVLFSLRALGESIGWGFQLQNPGFVLVLGMVFFLFGLNLLGVFEIGSGLVGADTKVAGRKDLFGSFGVGVLAAVVGAPCVGPFVGGVSGVALQANTFTGLLIFGMLGFGMAFPFLLFAMFPKLVAYLPKPGPWMETFKQSMGFLLMAALVFLIYLLGQQAGTFAMTVMLVVLFTASIGAWIYGRWAAPVKSARSKRTATLLALLLVGGSGTFGVQYVDFEQGDDGWAPWSEEAVESALAEGNPVFVDFTATWCLICQVNKRVALRTEATDEVFAAADVVTLSADWTLRDSAITKKLEEFDRSGVPLYLLYSPDGTVEILPQNLTNGIIRDAVEALESR